MLRAPELGTELAPQLRRLAEDDVGDAALDECGNREGADRAASRDEHSFAGLDAGTRDAVQCDRQRLGERGVTHRHTVGDAEELVGPDLDEVGEGTLELALFADLAAPGAEARPARFAVLALTTPHRGTAHRRVTDLPAGHAGTHRRDRAGVLVAAHRIRPAPALEHEVDVGAADPAVTHLEEHIVGAELGDRIVLDLDLPITLVDRRTHRLGHVCHHAGSVAQT